MKQQKRYYSKEYKLKAVALSEQRKSISSVAIELGIRTDMLGRWKREYMKDRAKAFIGGGNSKKKPPTNELSILKKQLREAELERDILKKAVGIFSKSDRSDITL